MAYDLDILCNFTLTVRGKTISFWQGTSVDDLVTTPFTVSVDGPSHATPFTLATATARTLWDDDDDFPADFDFLFYVADQNTFLQVIASATSFTVPVLAGVPFILAPKTDSLTAKCLGAATTTAMSGTAPSVTEIDSVVCQNNSGETTNGFFFVSD